MTGQASPSASEPSQVATVSRSSRLGDFMARYAVTVVFFALLIVLLEAISDTAAA